MYTAVKNRILQLLGEKKMSIHKLAMESAVAPSSIKNILYGKSQNPGVVTIKMLCDGFGITIVEFFNTEDFKQLEQEIKWKKKFDSEELETIVHSVLWVSRF